MRYAHSSNALYQMRRRCAMLLASWQPCTSYAKTHQQRCAVMALSSPVWCKLAEHIRQTTTAQARWYETSCASWQCSTSNTICSWHVQCAPLLSLIPSTGVQETCWQAEAPELKAALRSNIAWQNRASSQRTYASRAQPMRDSMGLTPESAQRCRKIANHALAKPPHSVPRFMSMQPGRLTMAPQHAPLRTFT